jgi:hypothetical protein
VGKLKENMIELDGPMVDMKTTTGANLPNYHEGPWMHKRGDWYYLSYADNHDDGYILNQTVYAMSKSPVGPWEYKDVVVGGTTELTQHGSIVEYKDQWYAFYHNKVLSYRLNPGPGGGARSICVDKLFYNEDGTMQRVVMTGLTPPDPSIGQRDIPNLILAENYTTGAKGTTWFDTDDVNDGVTYRTDGVDIQGCADGKANIFNIVAGEWLGYRLNARRTGLYKFEFRVASPEGKGAFHVEVDGVDKTGKITIPRTQDYQRWTTVYLPEPIQLNGGVHLFKICMDEPGFNLANFTISYNDPVPVGKKITLRAEGKYLTFNGNQLICNSASITPECVFTVEAANNYVTLKTSDGRYVSAKSRTSSMTVEASRTNTSLFSWYSVNTNQIGLKGIVASAIVCSEAGNKPANCDRYEIGAWETFTWQEYKDPTSIETETVAQTSVQVYPVPVAVNSQVNVSFNGKDASPVSIEIVDMQGKVCKTIEQTYNAQQGISVSTVGIPAGSYVLRVVSDNFSSTSKLIII